MSNEWESAKLRSQGVLRLTPDQPLELCFSVKHAPKSACVEWRDGKRVATGGSKPNYFAVWAYSPAAGWVPFEGRQRLLLETVYKISMEKLGDVHRLTRSGMGTDCSYSIEHVRELGSDELRQMREQAENLGPVPVSWEDGFNA